VKTLLLVLATLVAAPLTAHAQHVNAGALDDDAKVVTVTTGAEHGLMLGLGYGRVTSVADRPVLVTGDVTLGWAEVDVDDFRLRVGALAPLAGRGRWKVLGGFAAIVRGTENDLGRLTSVGVDAAVLAGRYTRRALIALELGVDAAMATHVAHSDDYRRVVYADAPDGWYGNPGALVRAGLQAGVSLGRHDLILRAGRMVDLQGGAPMIPFYGTLTYDARW
jgi:hypothetical protein